MSLLPRSRRGTWLLAGAVWLAACAGLWWALPIVPRTEMKLPEKSHFLCYGPDGRFAVVVNPIADSVLDRQLVDLDLIEVSSGRLLRKLIDRGPRVEITGQSLDGRTLLLWQQSYPHGLFLKVDLSELRVEELSLSEMEQSDFLLPRLSPDGRFAVLPCKKDDSAIRIWDVHRNQLHGMLTGVRPPLGFAGAGQPLLAAAEAGEQANRVVLVDIESLCPLAKFDGPDHSRVAGVSLSKSGQHLVADFETETSVDRESRLLCWNVAIRTGETRVTDLRRDPSIAAGSRLLVMNDESECASLHGVELQISSGVSLVAPKLCRSSPDCRLFLMEVGSVPSALENMSKRVGFAWPGRRFNTGNLYEATTGSMVGVVPVKPAYVHPGKLMRRPMDLRWSPDGRSIAIADPESKGSWHIWDIPPRKSLPWFATSAALSALPIAFAAHRRGRRLAAA